VAKVGYAQPTSAKHTLRATQRYARQAGCIITYPMLVSLATDPFPLVFGTLIGQLNKHLGTRFVPGHIDVGSPLARDLEEVLRLNNGHDYKTRDLCMMRLITLARDLEEIAAQIQRLLGGCVVSSEEPNSRAFPDSVSRFMLRARYAVQGYVQPNRSDPTLPSKAALSESNVEVCGLMTLSRASRIPRTNCQHASGTRPRKGTRPRIPPFLLTSRI
jgi:hypothetical protein